MSQIIGGLSNNNIEKLVHLWKVINPSRREEYSIMQDLMSMDKNFKNYRVEITKKGTTSILPYMPLHLRDLFLIQEQNLKKREENSMIIFDELYNMGKIINSVLDSKSYPTGTFNIDKSLLTLLRNVQYLTDDKMFHLSREYIERENQSKTEKENTEDSSMMIISGEQIPRLKFLKQPSIEKMILTPIFEGNIIVSFNFKDLVCCVPVKIDCNLRDLLKIVKRMITPNPVKIIHHAVDGTVHNIRTSYDVQNVFYNNINQMLYIVDHSCSTRSHIRKNSKLVSTNDRSSTNERTSTIDRSSEKYFSEAELRNHEIKTTRRRDSEKMIMGKIEGRSSSRLSDKGSMTEDSTQSDEGNFKDIPEISFINTEYIEMKESSGDDVIINTKDQSRYSKGITEIKEIKEIGEIGEIKEIKENRIVDEERSHLHKNGQSQQRDSPKKVQIHQFIDHHLKEPQEKNGNTKISFAANDEIITDNKKPNIDNIKNDIDIIDKNNTNHDMINKKHDIVSKSSDYLHITDKLKNMHLSNNNLSDPQLDLKSPGTPGTPGTPTTDTSYLFDSTEFDDKPTERIMSPYLSPVNSPSTSPSSMSPRSVDRIDKKIFRRGSVSPHRLSPIRVLERSSAPKIFATVKFPLSNESSSRQDLSISPGKQSSPSRSSPSMPPVVHVFKVFYLGFIWDESTGSSHECVKFFPVSINIKLKEVESIISIEFQKKLKIKMIDSEEVLKSTSQFQKILADSVSDFLKFRLFSEREKKKKKLSMKIF